MKFHIQTLGCKVNQYESQALESLLTERGHELSPADENCDVIIINTCSVTAESDRKSRQTVRKLHKQCPNAVIAVCGCFSQINPEAAEDLGADLVSGSGEKLAFLDELERVCSEKIKIRDVDEALHRRKFEQLPPGNLSGRTRAMLKIQDGCSNFCTYCIIPYSRGPSRSLPLNKAAEEAKKLYEEGYKEFIITGIEIASYGRDLLPKCTLGDVIHEIAENAPGVRIRIGSLEPRVITEQFCQKIADIKDICPHFHLSLQSGCDETLRRMRRRYDTTLFYESVMLLRHYFPGCAVAADLITGFPGETEEEFEKTLEFIQKCNFAFMHVFPYSERPGTAASSMPEKIEKSVRKERAGRVANIAERMEKAYRETCISSVMEVLFEQGKNGVFHGHAKNYCEVTAEGTNLHNEIRRVLITGEKNGVLFGNILL